MVRRSRRVGPKARVTASAELLPVPLARTPFINTASTLDGIIWGRFMAIGP